jgi:hypothetical protein
VNEHGEHQVVPENAEVAEEHRRRLVIVKATCGLGQLYCDDVEDGTIFMKLGITQVQLCKKVQLKTGVPQRLKLLAGAKGMIVGEQADVLQIKLCNHEPLGKMRKDAITVRKAHVIFLHPEDDMANQRSPESVTDKSEIVSKQTPDSRYIMNTQRGKEDRRRANCFRIKIAEVGRTENDHATDIRVLSASRCGAARPRDGRKLRNSKSSTKHCPSFSQDVVDRLAAWVHASKRLENSNNVGGGRRRECPKV